MELIYITDNDQYKPDFVLPNDEQDRHLKDYNPDNLARNISLYTTASTIASRAGVAAGLAALAPIAPVPILIAAATSAIAPSVIALLTQPRNTESKPDQIAKDAERAQQEINLFLKQHAVTLEQAKCRQYTFPIGHPKVGSTYRLHPLASTKSAIFKNSYILDSNFTETILAQKEAELVTMLIDMGATKIEIKETVLNNRDKSKNADLSGGNLMASAEASVNNKEENRNTLEKIKTIHLSGKPWHSTDTIDLSKFSWLQTETNWQSIVYAREVGGCLSADIEINESTYSEQEKNLRAQVRLKLAELSGGVSLSDEVTLTNSYLVSVEFPPPKP